MYILQPDSLLGGEGVGAGFGADRGSESVFYFILLCFFVYFILHLHH